MLTLTLKNYLDSLSVIFDKEERAYNFPHQKIIIFDFIIKNNLNMDSSELKSV